MVKLETIKSSKDFQDAKNGLFYRSASFLLQAVQNDRKGITRVGYTVSKQNGNAVNRNRIKRRLRMFFLFGIGLPLLQVSFCLPQIPIPFFKLQMVQI